MKNLDNILKSTKTRRLLLPLMAVALLFSVACDYAATTAPEAAKASAPTGEARSLADVNFLKWSPATWKQMTSLNASTIAAKTITVKAGGDVISVLCSPVLYTLMYLMYGLGFLRGLSPTLRRGTS